MYLNFSSHYNISTFTKHYNTLYFSYINLLLYNYNHPSHIILASLLQWASQLQYSLCALYPSSNYHQNHTSNKSIHHTTAQHLYFLTFCISYIFFIAFLYIFSTDTHLSHNKYLNQCRKITKSQCYTQYNIHIYCLVPS